MFNKGNASAAKSLLTPDNCAVLVIDHQPQMFFGVTSIDRAALLNNVVGLAKSVKAFGVPMILTTVTAKTFAGPMSQDLQAVFPDRTTIDRTNVNAWEDEKVVAAVEKTGRKKLVMCGLWTTICLAYPALSAMEAGYEVYVVADCCGDVDGMSHDMGMRRLIQAGAIPVTWLQVLMEFQRDWSRQATYKATVEVIRQHAGAYGQGIEFAEAMVEGFGESG